MGLYSDLHVIVSAHRTPLHYAQKLHEISFFSVGFKSLTSSDGFNDTILKAKDFKIVLEDPRRRRLVLEDSNTANQCSRIRILRFFTLQISATFKGFFN